MITFELNKLNCENCPAKHLRNKDRIEHTEKLRSDFIGEINEVKIILLGESTPANRFVYNLDSDYSNNGFRYNLRWELINGGRDDQLLNYLRKRGIIIVDCAFCPLHRLSSNTDRRDAATKCLSRHSRIYLDSFSAAKIITFFPRNLGFKKTELADIHVRVYRSFQFADLDGLKETINSIIGEGAIFSK